MEKAIRTDVPAGYAAGVAGRKVSTVLDDGTLQRARDMARYAGLSLSAWLARAARYHVQIEEGLREVDRYEAEFGPIPAEALREADEWLDRRGIRRLTP
jgi:hypothetical protein